MNGDIKTIDKLAQARKLERPATETYGILWLVGAFKIKGIKPVLHVGICGRTMKVMTVTNDPLSPLMVQDLIVTGDQCENAKGCLFHTCPLNRITPRNMARYTIFHNGSKDKPVDKEDFEKLLAKMDQLNELALEDIGDWDGCSPLAKVFNKPVFRQGGKSQ